METSIEIQLRFVDLDGYGHVNNAVYLSFCEVARLELVRELFFEDMKKNIQYVLIKAELAYLKPIRLTDKLIVDAKISEMGKVRFYVEYRLHNGDGVVFSKGHTVHAMYDANIGKPIRLPEEWVKKVSGGEC